MLKRVTKELNDFKEKPSSNIHLRGQTNSKDRGFQIAATIIGPAESPYAFSRFNLSIILPQDYPFRPPKIIFTTKIHHPNVYSNSGSVCCCTIRQLKDLWSPALTIAKLLEKIVNMMSSPLDTLSQCGDRETINQFKYRYNEFVKQATEEAIKHGENDELD